MADYEPSPGDRRNARAHTANLGSLARAQARTAEETARHASAVERQASALERIAEVLEALLMPAAAEDMPPATAAGDGSPS